MEAADVSDSDSSWPSTKEGDKLRGFWARHAECELHWFNGEAWLARHAGRWSGWLASDASESCSSDDWRAWDVLVDDSEAPFVRWFCGGRTSAAFNEIDRHVLTGHGSDAAFLFEPGPVEGRHDEQSPRAHCSSSISRLDLLLEATRAAHELRQLGLVSTQRLALFATNTPLAVVWMSAAKRLGLPYVAVAAGASRATLESRLADVAPLVLLTSTELEPTAAAACESLQAPPRIVVIDKEDGPCGNGSQLDIDNVTEADDAQRAVSLAWRVAAPVPVEANHPLFVLYTSGSTGRPKGIVHVHGGYAVGLSVTAALVLGIGSESTRETLLVVATPGWITGQSYMIGAALLRRTPSVLVDGSPISPADRLASVIARRRVTVLKLGSTIVRALMATPNAAELLAAHDVTSLRRGCFCAEPLTAGVHAFAHAHLCPDFINCYWATEHGGIVFGRTCASSEASDEPKLQLRADARSWPLPWVDPLVTVSEGDGWRCAAHGESGELVLRGMLHPYMALTVWSADEPFSGETGWRGDLPRWRRYWRAEAGYVQGDAAVRHADGSFTFPGRSGDDQMNVCGHRIAAAEVENALLLDREQHGELSPLVDCAVAGVPDELSGTVACAFVVCRGDAGLSEADENRLCALVHERLGWAAVPSRFVVVDALPRTHSGKYMRSVLRASAIAALESAAPPPSLDLTSLANPECVPALMRALRADGAGSAQPMLPKPTLPAPGGGSNGRESGISSNPEAVRHLLRSIWRRVLPSAREVDGAEIDSTPFGALGGASLAAMQAIGLAARRGLALAIDAAGLERVSIEQLVQSATGHEAASSGEEPRPHNELVPVRVGRYHAAAASAAPSKLVILERDGRKPNAHLRDVGGIAACAAGDVRRATQLRSEGWEAAWAVDKFGSTALMWAASFGQVDAGRWLIDEVRVAVNAQNKQGRTALMFATKYGQREMAAFLLLEAHADPKVRMRDESTAFDWAVFGGHQPTMELLAEHPEVDISAVNRFGCAAVQWASAAGNVATCRWLHARGVNLAHVNDSNHGAVEKAAYRGHDELLRWLLLEDEGPRLLSQLVLRDEEGRSVADLARMGGHEGTARWLEPMVEAEELRVVRPALS